jgi:hypothetical protein
MSFLRSPFLEKFGIVLILIGSFDPMEGSILINLGSLIFAASSWFRQQSWKWWSIAASASISFGVIALWTVSSIGGFDPKSEWWWLLAILPYPMAWLGLLGAFAYRFIRWVVADYFQRH